MRKLLGGKRTQSHNSGRHEVFNDSEEKVCRSVNMVSGVARSLRDAKRNINACKYFQN